MDKSNGYESIAERFIEIRERVSDGIGASSVRMWAQALPPGAVALDLGCGTGIPIAKVLIEEGVVFYGIDASPTMVNAFRKNFPGIPVECESVEDSTFFNRKFDAVIAWGLMFLLSDEDQKKLIQKTGDALQTGGKFLFTAPYQTTAWRDVLTGNLSRSLGSTKYKEWIEASGMSLLDEFDDEGGNHYFNAVKD